MTEVPMIQKPLICSANQWNGFYMIGTLIVKKLNAGGLNTDLCVTNKSISVHILKLVLSFALCHLFGKYLLLI